MQIKIKLTLPYSTFEMVQCLVHNSSIKLTIKIKLVFRSPVSISQCPLLQGDSSGRQGISESLTLRVSLISSKAEGLAELSGTGRPIFSFFFGSTFSSVETSMLGLVISDFEFLHPIFVK